MSEFGSPEAPYTPGISRVRGEGDTPSVDAGQRKQTLAEQPTRSGTSKRGRNVARRLWTIMRKG